MSRSSECTEIPSTWPQAHCHKASRTAGISSWSQQPRTLWQMPYSTDLAQRPHISSSMLPQSPMMQLLQAMLPAALRLRKLTCPILPPRCCLFIHCSIEYNVSYVYHSLYAYFDRDNVALPGMAAFFKVGGTFEMESLATDCTALASLGLAVISMAGLRAVTCNWHVCFVNKAPVHW